jgi:flagellar basal body-associated protein FliL
MDIELKTTKSAEDTKQDQSKYKIGIIFIIIILIAFVALGILLLKIFGLGA